MQMEKNKLCALACDASVKYHTRERAQIYTQKIQKHGENNIFYEGLDFVGFLIVASRLGQPPIAPGGS